VRHRVKRHNLLRTRRGELQVFGGEALDALRAIEQAPFGAKDGDGVLLRVDVLAQPDNIFVKRTGLIFAVIDHVGERHERHHKADIDETQHGPFSPSPQACRQAGSAIRGTPKFAGSRACGGVSVRSPALRRAERARGFSLISSFVGDSGRRLRSRKLGEKVDRARSGTCRDARGAGVLRAAKKRLAMRSSSEWKVTTASLPFG